MTRLPTLLVDRVSALVRAANPAAARMLGRAVEALPGVGLAEIFAAPGLPSTPGRWRSIDVRRSDGLRFAAAVTWAGADEHELLVLACPLLPRAARTVFAPPVAARAIAVSRARRATRACDARAVVEGALEDVRALAQREDVELEARVECSTVRLSPESFRKALGEVVRNAVQASRGRDSVLVHVVALAAGDTVWSVRDLGVGMTPGVLAGLGERGPQCGIGRVCLAVAEHDGVLRFESGVDAGTTVSIYLPSSQTP